MGVLTVPVRQSKNTFNVEVLIPTDYLVISHTGFTAQGLTVVENGKDTGVLSLSYTGEKPEIPSQALRIAKLPEQGGNREGGRAVDIDRVDQRYVHLRGMNNVLLNASE